MSLSRSNTPLSRPGTSASTSKSISADAPSAAAPIHVVALVEGKAVGREVGIATYSPTTGRATLSQLADSLSFVRTLHHVSCHEPAWVVVPDTAFPPVDGAGGATRATGTGGKAARAGKTQRKEPTQLVQAVLDRWDEAEVVPVARKYWSDDAGKTFLAQLAVDDEDRPALLVASDQKYLALCAAAALFKYLAASHSLVFAPASLKIKWDPLEGTMYLDAETAKNLEIVHNRVSAKSNQSLFGVLNRTHTPMAARLLRANLLQPTRVQSILEARLNAVDELIANEDRFERIRSALRPLAKIDMDKLIASLTQQDSETDAVRAERRVTQMLSLRSVVRSLIALCAAVDGVQSELLSKIRAILSDERLEIIDEVIAERLEDDTTQPDKKKTGLAQRNAKIWAVKASHSHLLDIAREAYKENVHDIIELVQGYQTVHSLPSLSVTFGQNLVMIVSEDDVDEDGLPGVFKNISKKGAKKLTCTTLELKKRQQRYNDSLAEIFLLSDQIIQQLVVDVLQGVSALYKSSEAVAMLDLLWSHAHVASLANYTRPEFTGTLAIKGGKHPILDKFNSGHPVTPNNVYSSDTSKFQIVQGPNMSGKTTYLTTVALITVQAMVGSFVPAEYASVALNDALLTRLSNDDDLTGSLSTFAAEMRSTASILSLVTPDSLVVVDELGRGTSTLEGTALAHAIAEALIQSKAACFFSTHFRDLGTTLGGFPSVQCLHLQVDATSKGGVRYNYRILDGSPDESHYGLQLAAVAGLPEELLAVAQDVSGTLSRLERDGRRASKSNKATHRRRVLLAIREKLRHALNSDLGEDELRAYLEHLQGEAVRDMSAFPAQ